MTNKDEEMVREWKWPWDGKLAQPVIAQVIFIALLFLQLFLPLFFFIFNFTSLFSLRCLNCKEHTCLHLFFFNTFFTENGSPNSLYRSGYCYLCFTHMAS